jgi:hypothetical protein
MPALPSRNPVQSAAVLEYLATVVIAIGKKRSVTMGRLSCPGLLALVGLAAMAPAAHAQSNVEAAQGWGLIGTWRVDCKQPASHDNPDLKYVVRDGKVFHDRDFGGTTDSHQVIVATQRPDKSLELVVNFTEFKETRQYAFVHGRSDTLRTVFNRNVDTGDYSIRDSKLTSSGQPSAWQFRCN